MAGTFAGIRVFDFTVAGAGPRAGRVLAELGAEVIKVEAPGDGDVMLRRPPTQRGLAVGYSHFNRGKKSVVLNLRRPADLEVAYALAERSDIFLNNMRPGVVERLGVGYEDLAKINPRIIYGYLSAWGSTGPLAAWSGADPVVQFFSGWCSIQGEAGGNPEFGRFVGLIDDAGAATLVGGILQALIRREVTGHGQKVEVSLLRSSLTTQITRVAEYLAGAPPKPMGSASSTTAPHQAFLCGDRNYLAVGVLHDTHWRAMCTALGVAELADDPRFASNADRVRQRDALIPLLDAIFLKRPSNWWDILLTRAGVPHGRFYDWENIRYHLQVRDNDYLSQVETPHQGKLYMVNPPWSFSESERPRLDVPRPGEHTDEVLAWIEQQKSFDGQVKHGVAGPAPSREGPAKALADLVVVDVTQGLCGPLASKLLADAGATVVKVEPLDGDYARRMGPPFIGSESAVFLALNGNKESITLDLSTEPGRSVLRRLVHTADVFLEDWGPGGAEERQCAYQRLRESSPRLVHGAITAFGEKGPLRHRPGAELVIQAMAEYHGGLGPVGGPPVRVGADAADVFTGIYAFNALLAALVQRLRTGRGQRVSISQLGTLIYCRGTVWVSQGDPDEWDGWAARPFMPPEYGYKTRDGRVYFILLRGDQEQFDRLMITLGLEEHLADSRFRNGGRDAVGIGRCAAEVKPIWEAAFRDRTTEELIELLQAHGALVAPLHDYVSLFRDRRVASLGLVREVEHPTLGTYRVLGSPWAFSELDDEPGGPAPLLGQHTREVLHRSGFAGREIQDLAAAGLIGAAPIA